MSYEIIDTENKTPAIELDCGEHPTWKEFLAAIRTYCQRHPDEQLNINARMKNIKRIIAQTGCYGAPEDITDEYWGLDTDAKILHAEYRNHSSGCIDITVILENDGSIEEVSPVPLVYQTVYEEEEDEPTIAIMGKTGMTKTNAGRMVRKWNRNTRLTPFTTTTSKFYN